MSASTQKSIKQVGGKYRVLSPLGRGAMGIVYLGEEIFSRRKAAIKILPYQLAQDARFLARFVRETEALYKIRHPNIVNILETGEVHPYGDERQVPYYVMEYVDGGTLAERLKQGTPLPLKEAMHIAREVAQGLGYAHDQGVIHRDVKPSNIMLASDGKVKVSDFGIAKVVQAPGLTMAATSVGTPEYMSPEQASGQSVDRRSDLYSLGVVIYEMLAGRAPFRDSSTATVMRAHICSEPDPLRNWNDTLPLWTESIVNRLLEKAPEKRYACAADLIAAIDLGLSTYQPLHCPRCNREQSEHAKYCASCGAHLKTGGRSAPRSHAAKRRRRVMLVGLVAALWIGCTWYYFVRATEKPASDLAEQEQAMDQYRRAQEYYRVGELDLAKIGFAVLLKESGDKEIRKGAKTYLDLIEKAQRGLTTSPSP